MIESVVLSTLIVDKAIKTLHTIFQLKIIECCAWDIKTHIVIGGPMLAPEPIAHKR